ncbi:hypothetical protein DZC76_15445 [Pseudomonas sp. phDV1]|nr:hypothetical protein [Pseudomonas sp. phDV1]AXO62488.1 hypothetical protein DZC76_15445 [Pseudomonas sp. phDV1]KFJ91154.1 hypothetical protein JF55_13930 [Pseudomonas sp. 1-7]
MHPALQITLAALATLAAIASAVAAWKAQTAAREALDFQKRLSKHQDSLFLLRSTIASLWQLKRILGNPIEARDDEFMALESIHRQIKRNLESLTQSGTLPPRESSLFEAQSFGEIVDQIPSANEEIDHEIKRHQAKIDEIFS